MAGKQALMFHHHAVRRYSRAGADIRSIQQHRCAANRCLLAYFYVVDLENAVLKRVRLELTVDCRPVAEVQHIGIDHLSESAAQHNTPSDAGTHRSEKR